MTGTGRGLDFRINKSVKFVVVTVSRSRRACALSVPPDEEK